VAFLGLGLVTILGNPEAQQALNDLGQIFQDNFPDATTTGEYNPDWETTPPIPLDDPFEDLYILPFPVHPADKNELIHIPPFPLPVEEPRLWLEEFPCPQEELFPSYFESQNTNSNSTAPIPEIIIDRAKYPETAQHIEDAIAAGHPDILTISRSDAKQNRKNSLKGHSTVSGKDRDEYPPAMFKEGGTGASVRQIDSSDNRGAGSSIGYQTKPYPDGTKVRIVVK
jgi:hypothetical protein